MPDDLEDIGVMMIHYPEIYLNVEETMNFNENVILVRWIHYTSGSQLSRGHCEPVLSGVEN